MAPSTGKTAFSNWNIVDNSKDSQGDSASAVSVVTGETVGGRTGNMLLIDATAENDVAANTSSYLWQKVNGVVPGVRYKISADVYIESIAEQTYNNQNELNDCLAGPQVVFKYDMYRNGATELFASDYRGNIKLVDAIELDIIGKWYTLEDYIIFPEETDGLRVIFSLNGMGKVYYDNLSVKICDELTLETNEYFYYSDLSSGIATATLAPKQKDDYKSVTFSIIDSDGDNVVTPVVYDLADEQTVNGIDCIEDDNGCYVVTWNFNPSVLPAEKTAYTLKAVLTKVNETASKEASEEIYKYPRPTTIDANGNIMQTNASGVPIAGTVFTPRILYHVNASQYATVKQAGFNVVQAYTANPNKVEAMLDEAEAAGIKVVLVLYANYQSAAHSNNITNTNAVIAIAKDHPATFGYMIMDEPTSHITHRDDACKKELIQSYKVIRNLDPKHPIINCQAEHFYPEIKLAEKATDILMINPYPWYNTKDAAYQSYFMEVAERAVEGSTKPVVTILQTFVINNTMTGNTNMLTTIDNYKNTYYRSLFLGAKGIGAYPFYDAAKYSVGVNSVTLMLDGTVNSNMGGVNVTEMQATLSAFWNDMIEFHSANGEASFFDNAFLNGQETVGKYLEDTDAITQIVNDTSGNIYLAVINNTPYDKSKGSVLTQGTAQISVSLNDIGLTGNYTAELKYGTYLNNNSDVTIGENDTLNIVMEFEQVLVYQLTAN